MDSCTTGSIPTVGSSKINNFGLCTRAHARLTLRIWPYLKDTLQFAHLIILYKRNCQLLNVKIHKDTIRTNKFGNLQFRPQDFLDRRTPTDLGSLICTICHYKMCKLSCLGLYLFRPNRVLTERREICVFARKW